MERLRLNFYVSSTRSPDLSEIWRLMGGSWGYIEILKTKKMALANLLDTKVQSELVRSRVQNITEMDAPSSFFFGLEKKQGQRRQIHFLLSETRADRTSHCLRVSSRRTKNWWRRSVVGFLRCLERLAHRSTPTDSTRALCCTAEPAGAPGSRHRRPHCRVLQSLLGHISPWHHWCV